MILFSKSFKNYGYFQLPLLKELCLRTIQNECPSFVLFQGYIPNCALAVEAMLATASLGAVWSSTSPDFGVTVFTGSFLFLVVCFQICFLVML